VHILSVRPVLLGAVAHEAAERSAEEL
jgi:hypothetical protein